MSVQVKRLFKKLVSISGIVFFAIAAGMLYWQLSKFSLSDIFHIVFNIPLDHLLMAGALCLAGYVVLSFYDYLALRYLGRMVSWWRWMLGGMLGFAISNNAGTAVISGGSIRYRLYTRWRIKASEIVKMMTFIGITYFLGASAVLVGGYFFIPQGLFDSSSVIGHGINVLMIFCATALTLCYGFSIFYRRTIRAFGLNFKMPHIKMALAQTATGAMDSILAGLVLYSIISAFIEVPFGTFIAVFLVAQTTGIYSQVPGGLGVFESIMVAALPAGTGNEATIFASLIAFRVIYYVMPLFLFGGLFFIYEHGLKLRMKRWADEARALAHMVSHPHIHMPHPHMPHIRKKKPA
ncbi:MAG: lysylphosphatidylglycerol synthase domain-containing protein [Rickettsiales bacterium]|jgi:phosphatidylglycerol lysyltransferase|nr:lysylphosphatidylglycerol synthase domain-containing protein [Rickettsiales bacterium]